MRISSLALPVLLAGCADSGAADAAGETGEASGAEAGGTVIACALDGAADFADACWYERVERDGERLLIVHHPDGGFRRLALVEGGGLAAADGADEPSVTVADGMAEVSLAGSRYRLPLKAQGDDGGE
jgi:hypothetical protein